ncbi:MAG: nicotianamine synthase family protein [Tumebacillaceae bacterium]
MKEKYEFLLSLKSFEYEINELNGYSKDDPICYELLREKLDELCDFITSEENARRWSMWEHLEEIKHLSIQLRGASVQALCDIEKYQSLCMRNDELNISDYINVLSGSVQKEVEEFGIDHASKVLFVGSGALPLSALMIAKETGAEVMCLDIDAEAVELGREAAEFSGLQSKVQFTGNSVKELEFLNRATHILIASLVEDKEELVNDLKDVVSENVKIVLRYGNGLKSLFNFPLVLDLSDEWEQTKITWGNSIYDTVVLQAKNSLVKGR